MQPVLSEANVYELNGDRINKRKNIELVDIPVESQETKKKQQSNQEMEVVERQASLAFGFQNGALAKSKGTIIDTYGSGSVGVTTLSATDMTVETEHVTRDPSSIQNDRVATQGLFGVSKCQACREIVNFVCANSCYIGAGAICVAVAFITGPGATACAFIATVVCRYYRDDVAQTCYRATDTVCRDIGFC